MNVRLIGLGLGTILLATTLLFWLGNRSVDKVSPTLAPLIPTKITLTSTSTLSPTPVATFTAVPTVLHLFARTATPAIFSLGMTPAIITATSTTNGNKIEILFENFNSPKKIYIYINYARFGSVNSGQSSHFQYTAGYSLNIYLSPDDLGPVDQNHHAGCKPPLSDTIVVVTFKGGCVSNR
jgi:hypothetical protein